MEQRINEKSSIDSAKDHLGKAASDLMDEGSRRVKDLYSEGLNKASEVEKSIEEYTDSLAMKIRKKPITSVLIAAGICYIWEKLS
jgi:hypothetical protein